MTLDDQINCIKREIKRRKKFYPLMVRDGKLTQDEANLELCTIQAALETLTQLKGLLSK